MRETETSAGHAGEAEGRRRSGPKSPVADQKLRDYYSGLDDFELEVEEEEVAPSYLSAVPEAVMPTAAHIAAAAAATPSSAPIASPPAVSTAKRPRKSGVGTAPSRAQKSSRHTQETRSMKRRRASHDGTMKRTRTSPAPEIASTRRTSAPAAIRRVTWAPQVISPKPTREQLHKKVRASPWRTPAPRVCLTRVALAWQARELARIDAMPAAAPRGRSRGAARA